MNYLNAFWAEK